MLRSGRSTVGKIFFRSRVLVFMTGVGKICLSEIKRMGVMEHDLDIFGCLCDILLVSCDFG